MVNEFFLKDSFLEMFPRIDRKTLVVALDNVENSEPACRETGYMRRFSIDEIFGRLDGTFVDDAPLQGKTKKKLVTVPRNLLPMTEQHRFDASTIYRLDHGMTDMNGTFIYPGTVLEAPRPELKDTAKKLLSLLTDLKARIVQDDPKCRDAKLPAVAPLLKLAAIQDPAETGIIDEDYYVNVLQQAFPKMSHEELYLLVSLGRTGEPRSRKIDYAKFVSTLRSRFETASPG